jgi:hypothetical protein
MREKQEIEQYFFDASTLDDMARLASRFDNPCCLCTPSLGEELEQRGVQATTLDLDERFTHLRGFRPYDLAKPEPLSERFGIIICDPPFLTISLPQLFEAIKMLSQGDYTQPLIINNLSSRAPQLIRVFASFGLQPTGYRPRYRTIQNIGRNRMELFGNVEATPEIALNGSISPF